MSKFKGFLCKASVAAAGALCGAYPALAEGTVTNPLETLQTEATTYIGFGKTMVVTILSAGLVIVASFYLFRLIKRALGGAK